MLARGIVVLAAAKRRRTTRMAAQVANAKLRFPAKGLGTWQESRGVLMDTDAGRRVTFREASLRRP